MKKIKAFSIPELMFVLVFVGIISIVALQTINNRFSDYFNRYYLAYDSLSKTAYNTYVDTYCREDAEAPECKDDVNGLGRIFPENAKALCKRFGEYLNTGDDNTCGNIKTISNNPEDKEFEDKAGTLQMTLRNGFKLYFSDKNSVSTPVQFDYFIVYVDLNGDAKPNSIRPTSKEVGPDIVPFAVTRTGDVIPVGYPIFDKRYASARLIDSDGNESKSFTIDAARQLAFGNGDDSYFLDIPLTLTPLVEDYIPKPTGSNIDKGWPIRVNYNIGAENTTDYKCTKGTYNCTIKIDENEGLRR